MQALLLGASTSGGGPDVLHLIRPTDAPWPSPDDDAAAGWYQLFGATPPAKLGNIGSDERGLQSANSDLQILIPTGAFLRAAGGPGRFVFQAFQSVIDNAARAAALELIADKYGPAASAVVPFIPTLAAILRRRPVVAAAFRRFTRRFSAPASRPGWNEPWTPPKSWNGPVNHGEWTGPRGNSNWIDNRPEVIKIVGIDSATGKANPIPYYKGQVDFSKWSKGELKVPGLLGTKINSSTDMKKILTAIAEKEGLQSQAAARRWLNERGLSPHPAGGDKIQLVPRDLHKVQHTDPTHR